jgi:hypothetical protein
VPVFRPFVSSNAYPGSGRAIVSASLIGGFSRYFWSVWTIRCFIVYLDRNYPLLVSFVCDQSHAAAAATLRTANENIARVTPLIIMLTPTSVPIAQTELEGHWR